MDYKYDHIWIPKSIEEQLFVLKNNKVLLDSPYFLDASKRGSLFVFYYNKHRLNGKGIQGHDNISVIDREEYLNNVVKDTKNTSLKTLKKCYPDIIINRTIKY